MSKGLQYLQRRQVVLVFYLLVALIASVHLIALGNKEFNGLPIYKHYNNYIIFKQAFLHLIHYQDLYQLFPDDQYDLYKYSPTFALAMAPFAAIPDEAGLIIWNLLNAFLIFYAVQTFQCVSEKTRVFMLWFLLQETLTGLQSAQTNPLIAALLILAFNAFEQRKVMYAALFIVLTAYIKIFGVVAFLLFLLYPQKGRFILWSVIWTLVLAVLPLIVVSPEQLIFLYKSWLNLLQNDHTASYGLSVMGWLKTWFGLEPDKMVVVFAGALLLLLPYVRVKAYADEAFRTLSLASMLIWVIVFNHKAESSTFVIAISGVAIWFFTQPKSKWHIALVIFAFVFTCLSPTDLFPRLWRKEFVEPFVMKAVPCIFIWLWIQWTLLGGKYKAQLQ